MFAARERWEDHRYYYNNGQRPQEPVVCVVQRTRRGRAFFDHEGKSWDVNPGEAMLFFHGDPSAYGYPPGETEPYELDFVALTGSDIRRLFGEIRLAIGPVVSMPEGSNAERCLTNLVNRFQNRSLSDRFSESVLVYEFLMACWQLNSQDQPGADPLRIAHEHLLTNFQRPLSMQELAETAGLSREHLSRTFTKRYGASPKSFLTTLRMARARDILTAFDLPVQDIATTCGYSDANSFVRAFRAIHGVPPAMFALRNQSRATQD